MKMKNPNTRPLYEIAKEISFHWRNPYFGAGPYIAAMHNLYGINDTYGADSASSIVRYFLSNARMWRGDVARRIKAELNAMLKQIGK